MILKAVSIRGFRSIQEEQRLLVDDLVTVLVGANDHGKSNILQAILALNDNRPFVEADRHWDEDAANAKIPVVRWEFELTGAEREQLAKERLKGAVPIPKEVEDEDGKEAGAVGPEPVYEAPGTITFEREGVGSSVYVIEPDDDVLNDEQADWLLERRPRVELFEPQKIGGDEVELADLGTEKFEFMKGIFMKAGLWDKRTALFVNTGKTDFMLDEGSKRLTATLRQEWEQGKELEWKFDHSGAGKNTICLRIKDPAIKSTYVSPSQRSAGFTAFFVLSLAIYARTQAQKGQSFIYLFDEPGSYLHPHAQVNLQRVFERLAERAQIVYTTHSIFLVNKNVPKRNRVVRKVETGTEIEQKPFSGNWRATRDSLGLLFSQNFFIADRTLLVEGPSDELYWATIMLYLIRSGETECDINAFSVAQGGDSQNLMAMASLMLEDGRKVAVLVDGDKSGKKVLKDLKKLRGADIEDGRLSLMSLPDGSSIEDLVPRRGELFEAAVDAADALVQSGVREWSEARTRDERLAELREMDAARGTDTLGLGMKKVCSKWFKGGKSGLEPLSKVAIAMKYESRVCSKRADENEPIADVLRQQSIDVEQALGLGSRKAEQAILEQVSE